MKRLHRAWAVLLCLAFALPASSAAAQSHPYLFSIVQFVPKPNVIETFEGPCGVTVDSAGALYVSDYYHDKVDVFTAGGGFLTSIDEVEPLDGPCGLAVDSTGRLFVNVLHRNVTRFTPQAFPLLSKTPYGTGVAIDSERSTGVAVDPASGRIYVNDRTHVAVYEPSGAPVLDGGTPLRIGVGSLGDAYGVAVSDYAASAGFVYVADHADDVIEVFDPATDPSIPIATIDGAGVPGGGFTTLRDASLALDNSTGHLFVVFNAQGPFYEHPRAAVAEFNSAGEYRGTLPAPTPLWFGEPSGIAVDNWGGATRGRVYVTTGNSEVESAAVPPGQPAPPIRKEEGALYAFGPSVPGARLEVAVSGAGEGKVTSMPAGIACPGACAAEYDEGSAVTLTATPGPGSAFAGWSGGGCSGTGGCTVTLATAASVTAEFSPAPSPLGAPTAAGAAQEPTSAPGAPAGSPAGAPGAAAEVGRRQHRHTARSHPRRRGRSSKHRNPRRVEKTKREGAGAKR